MATERRKPVSWSFSKVKAGVVALEKLGALKALKREGSHAANKYGVEPGFPTIANEWIDFEQPSVPDVSKAKSVPKGKAKPDQTPTVATKDAPPPAPETPPSPALITPPPARKTAPPARTQHELSGRPEGLFETKQNAFALAELELACVHRKKQGATGAFNAGSPTLSDVLSVSGSLHTPEGSQNSIVDLHQVV
jgi:hypothetical protein